MNYTFPGHIFDAIGRNLGGTAQPLCQDQLDACPHRSLVSDCDAPSRPRASSSQTGTNRV